MTISVWRRIGLSGVLLAVLGLSIVLPGCGQGSGANTTGPNPEVQIVPPKDAQGHEFPITDEAKTPG